MPKAKQQALRFQLFPPFSPALRDLPGASLSAFHSYVASYNLITIPLLSSLPDLACKEQPLNTTTHTLLPMT